MTHYIVYSNYGSVFSVIAIGKPHVYYIELKREETF